MSLSYFADAYRSASIGGASQIGILLVAYDAMATGLQQAARAQQKGDIEQRCVASNRVLTILAHVETWADELGSPDLGHVLRAFYSDLRGRIVAAQASASADNLESIVETILQVRSTWQLQEQRLRTQSPVFFGSNGGGCGDHWRQGPALDSVI